MFLSIVTPSYNRAHTLPKCYESLLSQTDYDFEWIIVDDGSSDNTKEIAKLLWIMEIFRYVTSTKTMAGSIPH